MLEEADIGTSRFAHPLSFGPADVRQRNYPISNVNPTTGNYRNSSAPSSARNSRLLNVRFPFDVSPDNSTNSLSTQNQDEMPPLPAPVQPWLNSGGGSSHSPRTSIMNVDGSSLHIMKRYMHDGVPRKMRWSKHKWLLLVANTLLFIYGLGASMLVVLTWFKLFERADTVIVGEPVLLGLVTAMGGLCLLTSLLGYTGIMLNNRGILAIYNVLLWPCFALIASVGYVSYRKNKWNLEAKLRNQWHDIFDRDDRSRVQANLRCCGYKEFADWPERSSKCFPRTLLPGCKYKYQTLTKSGLIYTYTITFLLLPVHIFVIFVALLCSNHVNRKFGKGLPPKIYRIDYNAVGIVAADPTTKSDMLTGVRRKESQRRQYRAASKRVVTD
ncbi:hypothetical protein BC936DRAFT_149746 [Jimgerdemannia flammicorona]|uniref:Tetraspanin Tsp2 n=1 Tax=Jimgerdemannia flammicorona TaxID=994334 RepID=A0A433DK16_9FUNG|nr:hypothetical protein BC936DRAFT_149746 [Jimgerdemannia flammicorona]